jgi:PEP-CTERM motif
MKITHRTLVSAALVAGSTLAMAPGAKAGPALEIAVGSGNCGTVLTPTTGVPGFEQAATLAGGFLVSAEASGLGPFGAPPPNLLDSQTLDVSGKSGGSINVCITETGVDGSLGGPLLSSLTTNILPKGWTLTESTYADASDTAFGKGTALYSATWGPSGSSIINATASGTAAWMPSAPYSLTEIYSITASGAGDTNDTIDITEVPEPATLAIFAGGLLAGALALSRRRRA